MNLRDAYQDLKQFESDSSPWLDQRAWLSFLWDSVVVMVERTKGPVRSKLKRVLDPGLHPSLDVAVGFGENHALRDHLYEKAQELLPEFAPLLGELTALYAAVKTAQEEELKKLRRRCKDAAKISQPHPGGQKVQVYSVLVDSFRSQSSPEHYACGRAEVEADLLWRGYGVDATVTPGGPGEFVVLALVDHPVVAKAWSEYGSPLFQDGGDTVEELLSKVAWRHGVNPRVFWPLLPY